jgi:hypothetical protein
MFDRIADFTADKFSPTTWEPSKKKAQFAKTFIRFRVNRRFTTSASVVEFQRLNRHRLVSPSRPGEETW